MSGFYGHVVVDAVPCSATAASVLMNAAATKAAAGSGLGAPKSKTARSRSTEIGLQEEEGLQPDE
jgi:hypothetical protein